jgi:acyl-coenzyme A thioesterase PaaI-like protein
MGGSEVNKFFRKHVRRLINWWPPLLGAGIRVTRWDADWRVVDVEMKLSRWNRNYVGTHYGGSLYSMTDPFYMVMLIENLGRGYVVWDKSASIRFRRPGHGMVRAEFRLVDAQIQEIRAALEKEEKVEREFAVEVKDENGEVVAEVKKLVHVRRTA